MEDQLAASTAGVDLLVQRLEPDPTRLQITDRGDQVPQGAPEAVQSPHNELVLGAEHPQTLLELRTVCPSPRHLLDEDFLALRLPQGIHLQVGRLILRRYPRVANAQRKHPYLNIDYPDYHSS